MTIQNFITKAIEGGWKPSASWFGDVPVDSEYHTVLLNPEAWQAVGKVEGWAEYLCGVCRGPFEDECVLNHGGMKSTPEWKYNFIDMACKLADGQTIEQFIETL